MWSVTFKVHPLCLHTPFPAMLSLAVAFLERILWDVIQNLCYKLLNVLLTQDGALSLLISLFEKEKCKA
jgi:hypothetical protein